MEGTPEYPDELQPFILHMFSLASSSSTYSNDGLLSTTARSALLCISTNCNYNSFEEFIYASSEPILSTLILDFHGVLVSLPSEESTSPAVQKLEIACRALTYFVEHSNIEGIQRMQPLVMQVCF